jgi:hypothetical protein
VHKAEQWTEVTDEATGLVYYWNERTDETTAVGEPKPTAEGGEACSLHVRHVDTLAEVEGDASCDCGW